MFILRSNRHGTFLNPIIAQVAQLDDDDQDAEKNQENPEGCFENDTWIGKSFAFATAIGILQFSR